MRTITDFRNLEGLTKAEVVPMYANFILTEPPHDQIIRVNAMIIQRWSLSALSDIKDKAWRALGVTAKTLKTAK